MLVACVPEPDFPGLLVAEMSKPGSSGLLVVKVPKPGVPGLPVDKVHMTGSSGLLVVGVPKPEHLSHGIQTR